MIVHTTATCLTLLPGQFTRLQLRAGTRLRGLRGTAWLTVDNDPHDIVLDPQDEWVVQRDGQLLACACVPMGAPCCSWTNGRRPCRDRLAHCSPRCEAAAARPAVQRRAR